MLEPMREPRLALEVHEEVVGHRALVRNLERDACAVNRVDGLVYGGRRAVGYTSLDTVFTEFLSSPEQGRTAGMI